MNLFLHGASDFNIMQGDTLRSPKILSGGEIAKFDCVIANPPFSLEQWGSVDWASDKYNRNIWGTPSDSCGDYAWIQHMVQSMSQGKGRMAVVMPQGVLFRGNEEGRIREKLVKSDLIEAVVTLGDKLFYGTGLSPCFLVLRKVKPAEHSARILMIDGTKILTQKRAQNVLEPADVDRLYQLYKDYADVEDFSKVVTLEQVAEKEFNLSPNRYVEYHKEEIRPYEEVKAEFLSALAAVKEAEAQFQLIINE
jgi:type I restriction enzyme M protein